MIFDMGTNIGGCFNADRLRADSFAKDVQEWIQKTSGTLFRHRCAVLERFLVENKADPSSQHLVSWPKDFSGPYAIERFALAPMNAVIPCDFVEAAKVYPTLVIDLSKLLSN